MHDVQPCEFCQKAFFQSEAILVTPFMLPPIFRGPDKAEYRNSSKVFVLLARFSHNFAQYADLFKSRRHMGDNMTRLHEQCWRCEYFSENLPDYCKSTANTSREACTRLQDISAPSPCPDFTCLEDIKGKVLHMKDGVSGKWTEVSG
jgi:hypothetical protein